MPDPLPHLTEEERRILAGATKRGAWMFGPEVVALCRRLSLARAVVEAARKATLTSWYRLDANVVELPLDAYNALAAALLAHDAGEKGSAP